MGRTVLVLGLFAVAAAAGAGFRVYQERPTTGEQAPPPAEPLQPTTRPTQFPALSVELSRSGDRLLVRNGNDHPWTDCMLDLNAGVRGGSYSTELGDVGVGEQAGADLDTFARADGRRFDPEAERVLVVDLHCSTPRGPGHFGGRLPGGG